VKKVSLLLFMLLLQSCGGSMGLGDDGESDGSYHEQKYYANGVKLISKNIDDPRDPKSMQQKEYTIGPNSRLLTRLEGMSERSGRAVVDGEKRMYMAVSSEEFVANKGTYEGQLEICPITKNWMMLATWNKAHPFPTKGSKWSRAGGDLAQSDCVTADVSYPDQQEDTLYFDISDWYIYYVRSRGRNFGLMIKSSLDVKIYGDEDTIKAPRFIWSAR
jgi:hypothetical protein